MPSPPSQTEVVDFITRWSPSGGAELANSQLFLSELCDLLGVPRPEPTVPEVEQNRYTFERSIPIYAADGSTTTGRVDLYRRGCFVLESKQGVLKREEDEAALFKLPRQTKAGTATRETPGWDKAMRRAKAQAERYVRNLPAGEGRPPFIVVVDVGHTIELYSEFTCTGGTYVPYPDPQNHRIRLDDLRDEKIRERLRLVWDDPFALDPSRRSARVTREIADHLARLAKKLEADGHAPEAVATFLMRCLFTLFAEDVDLLPEQRFTELLRSLLGDLDHFKPMVEDVWRAMKSGGFSAAMRDKLLHFNGALFESPVALALTGPQLELLIEAAEADWREVEPAIFGTLLERALSPKERHKLGAHYTPRAYVERLVLPTVVEPLRDEWQAAQAAAQKLSDAGDTAAARAELETFHRRLCEVKVLDPACGSGNFLYVTLEHLKRLEGEVLDAAAALGGTQLGLEHAGGTVGPHQLLGLEINPRAAAIAELVLWIGYLQWHMRTHGETNPPEPIIEPGHTIEHRDAVLEYDKVQYRRGEDGKPVMRWDGESMKEHPVTGQPVPDETKVVPVEEYVNPRPAVWPTAEFVVGNPPFIGKAKRRSALGDGYLEALDTAYPQMPAGCDYVMYWWAKAARLVNAGKLKRLGLITTNSIRQSLNRRVVASAIESATEAHMIYAIPDHPWVDSESGAAVRIAMTVFGIDLTSPNPAAAKANGNGNGTGGRLATVVAESATETEEVAVHLTTEAKVEIHPDLRSGVALSQAIPLKANDGIAHVGVVLFGKGFLVDAAQAADLEPEVLKPLVIARDITRHARDVAVIDFYPYDDRQALERAPQAYQHLRHHVKPARDHIRDRSSRANWWRFGRDKAELRAAMAGLSRFIVTPEVSKHRLVAFLPAKVLPDHTLVAVASDDAYHLGILSSRFHTTWSLAAGSRMGVGNDPRYNKSRCFDPFPFPTLEPELEQRIRDLGERLDAHRKARQAEHPELTLTDMYNVLEKLRAGETFTDKDRRIHEQGLVTILRLIHDELDEAVAEAYGWPADLPDEEILERLVALNRERAAEESRGLVRWLRPEYQNPGGTGAAQLGIDVGDETVTPTPVEPRPWPDSMPAQAQAIKSALDALAAPADVEAVGRCFKGRLTPKRRSQIGDWLETLATLGQVRRVGEKYAS